jgi:16S rRNA (guanine966-N2)-methyltransferase
MVRIIGGEARGRSLKVHSGGQVRPTSDKVRQALFNILSHRCEVSWEGARVLDLYAGSGSLGLEALSRGAGTVVFVESNRKVVAVLKENIRSVRGHLKNQDEGSIESHVRVMTVNKALSSPPDQPYHVILIDPPYALNAGHQLLERLDALWLHPEGFVVIEHERRDLFEVPNRWTLNVRRLYGDTHISICQRSDLA